MSSETSFVSVLPGMSAISATAIAVAVLNCGEFTPTFGFKLVSAESAARLEADISGSEERTLRSRSASKGETRDGCEDERPEPAGAKGEGAGEFNPPVNAGRASPALELANAAGVVGAAVPLLAC